MHPTSSPHRPCPRASNPSSIPHRPPYRARRRALPAAPFVVALPLPRPPPVVEPLSRAARSSSSTGLLLPRRRLRRLHPSPCVRARLQPPLGQSSALLKALIVAQTSFSYLPPLFKRSRKKEESATSRRGGEGTSATIGSNNLNL